MTDLNDGTRPGPPVPFRTGVGGARRARAAARTDRAAAKAASARRWPLSRTISIALLVVLLFSLAHHAGTPGEAFTWFAFVFRWLAGVYFAWVFVVRGFGVAVGTHTAYDLLVGWLGWHF